MDIYNSLLKVDSPWRYRAFLFLSAERVSCTTHFHYSEADRLAQNEDDIRNANVFGDLVVDGERIVGV